MEKNEKILLICESPNKTKTLKEFLPSNYIVMASVGHITKIQDSGLYNMGIDVANDFKPDIVVDPNKKDVVKRLKEQVKLVDRVVLASDEDREGEYIAKNLKDVLYLSEGKYSRVTFHEITEKVVLEALKNPRKIDMNLAAAAESRSILDKIVGFRVSPITMQKVNARSAGRVQSAALRILVDRELEIQNFIPKVYYELFLHFDKDNKEYTAQYKGTDAKKTVSLDSEDVATKVIKDCVPGNYFLKKIETKERSLKSKEPFTTSTLQQECSNKLGLAPKRAMEYAQKLFEGIELSGKHVSIITYIRTDSTSINEEFKETLETWVKDKYGNKYFSPVKKGKKSKNAQEGHECIRPVDLTITPENLSGLIDDSMMVKVYKLIYNRTLAAAMTDCIMEDTEYSIYNGKHRFALSSHKIKFDGFKAAYNYSEEDDDSLEAFPSFVMDEKINDKKLETIKKETSPSSRYSEANLIKKMEELGIGRPSTYASTIAILKDDSRGYTEMSGKTLVPTEKGIRLISFLNKAFPDIFNYAYTADLENQLDIIADGKLDKLTFLDTFYKKLTTEISAAATMDSEKAPVELVGRKCPNCNSDLVYRTGRYGKFIACSSYGAGRSKCTYTEKINAQTPANENKPAVQNTGIKCPKCGSDIVIRTNSKTNQQFYACSGFPKCKNIISPDDFKKLVDKQSTPDLYRDND